MVWRHRCRIEKGRFGRSTGIAPVDFICLKSTAQMATPQKSAISMGVSLTRAKLGL
jgi:hypothetical protein